MYIPGNDAFNAWQKQQEQNGGIRSMIAGSPIAGPGQTQSQLNVMPITPVAPTTSTPYRTIADDWMNRPTAADSILGINRMPATPAPTPTLPGVGLPQGFPGTAGTGNGDFYGSGNAPALTSGINRLLDPNDAQANYDVTMHGAENAVFRGVPGSGVAAETTGRLRQADIERRLALGAGLVNQAGQLQLGRDQLTLATAIQTGQLTLDQARLELQRQVQNGQLDIERARLALQWYQQIAGGGTRGGGGVGGNQGNRAGGGVAPIAPETDPRTGAAFQSWQPLKYPSFTPRGASSATAPAPIVAPDNWDQMTPQEQSDYAAQYRSNQANYGANPWASDEGNWANIGGTSGPTWTNEKINEYMDDPFANTINSGYWKSEYGPTDEGWPDWYDEGG